MKLFYLFSVLAAMIASHQPYLYRKALRDRILPQWNLSWAKTLTMFGRAKLKSRRLNYNKMNKVLVLMGPAPQNVVFQDHLRLHTASMGRGYSNINFAGLVLTLDQEDGTDWWQERVETNT
ncbi:hypothetical protein GALMADRAFT_216902 [Galerina marginata CBS 339.88]|uniref:Uncharacterized protein n=1 Tax=Galerina marginata (strain CBS 339.88) TaxID=685588 RepID=A0A067SIU6_GALM3|nr:hypothetical protein GALMADRAFT_216902 [Galerina marginata CBS 339.88]